MKYHSVETTPLKFHTFYRFVSMPFGCIAGTIAAFNNIAEMTNVFYLIDIFFCALQAVCCATAFVGCFKWKSYAWYAIIINLVGGVVYQILVLIIHLIFTPEFLSYDVGTLFGTGIVSVLVFIYYNNRKALFFSSATPTAEAPFGSCCPNCGAPITDAGRFCTDCGTALM